MLRLLSLTEVSEIMYCPPRFASLYLVTLQIHDFLLRNIYQLLLFVCYLRSLRNEL